MERKGPREELWQEHQEFYLGPAQCEVILSMSRRQKEVQLLVRARQAQRQAGLWGHVLFEMVIGGPGLREMPAECVGRRNGQHSASWLE